MGIVLLSKVSLNAEHEVRNRYVLAFSRTSLFLLTGKAVMIVLVRTQRWTLHRILIKRAGMVPTKTVTHRRLLAKSIETDTNPEIWTRKSGRRRSKNSKAKNAKKTKRRNWPKKEN